MINVIQKTQPMELKLGWQKNGLRITAFVNASAQVGPNNFREQIASVFAPVTPFDPAMTEEERLEAWGTAAWEEYLFDKLTDRFKDTRDELMSVTDDDGCTYPTPEEPMTHKEKQTQITMAVCRMAKVMSSIEDTYHRWKIDPVHTDITGAFLDFGEYLATAWYLLKVKEAPLKEYTVEELNELRPDDICRYEMALPPDKRSSIHAELMAFYDRRNFMKNADWVVEMCGQVKVKYGVDGKCAIEIVKAALLRGIEIDLS